MGQKDIDALIDSFINEEQNISPNPFLITRVMGLVNAGTKEEKKFFPVWQGMAMALSLFAAVAVGVKAGSLYRPSALRQDQTSVMFMNDEKMEHFKFYQQTPNE